MCTACCSKLEPVDQIFTELNKLYFARWIFCVRLQYGIFLLWGTWISVNGFWWRCCIFQLFFISIENNIRYENITLHTLMMMKEFWYFLCFSHFWHAGNEICLLISSFLVWNSRSSKTWCEYLQGFCCLQWFGHVLFHWLTYCLYWSVCKNWISIRLPKKENLNREKIYHCCCTTV